MASKPTRVEKTGATPSKLALIGALGVVLIVVLYLQFGRSSDVVPPVAGELSAARRADVGRTAVNQEREALVAGETTERVTRKGFDQWRPPALAAVIEHDPFALPASFPQPRLTGAEAALAEIGELASDQTTETVASLEEQVQQSRTELEALRRLGVQVVMRQDDGYIAMIGDRTIHVGDEINGFTVIAIDSEGVRVTREFKP